MQERHKLRMSGVQTSQQGFAEEVMQAIAVPLLIQRHQEEVGTLQQREHLLTGCSRGCGGNGLAHGGVQTREDGAVE